MKIELSDDIRATMAQVLSVGGFATPETAAWEVSLTIALAKISRYERECAQLQQKYHCSLQSLRERVERMIGEEDSALDDDLMDWEFADQALAGWKRRVEVLRRAIA